MYKSFKKYTILLMFLSCFVLFKTLTSATNIHSEELKNMLVELKNIEKQTSSLSRDIYSNKILGESTQDSLNSLNLYKKNLEKLDAKLLELEKTKSYDDQENIAIYANINIIIYYLETLINNIIDFEKETIPINQYEQLSKNFQLIQALDDLFDNTNSIITKDSSI